MKRIIVEDSKTVTATLTIKDSLLEDLDKIVAALNANRSKLISSILEDYIYSDQDVVIQYKDKQVKISDILSR